MEELELIMHDINVTKFDVLTEHWVHIIHVINPHNFYVRPTKCRAFIEKLEVTKPTTRPCSVSKQNFVIYNIGQTGKDAKYARGRICHADNENGHNIFAVDYGYFHRSVSIDHIWECEQDLSKIPPLALLCQLSNCAPLGRSKDWSKETIDAFKDYVKNERAKMIILDRTFDKLFVELINSNPNDIATLMALTGYSTLGYVHNAINTMAAFKIQKIYLTFKNININETLHVRVQSGKSLDAFYVAEVNDYHNYMQEYNTMTYYTKKEPKLKEGRLKLNTPVCVKNDLGDYERAIIKEITVPDTKAIVKLVDWGKEEQVHKMNMRPIPERFLKMPVIAIYCSSEEKQLWDNGLHRFLYPGFEFLIQIKKLGKQFESPNIVKILPLQGNSSKASE
ncbi:maternal protein tudor [Nymphalis io]|uniref:maternal protein tudor n=1 Tax=Inachis io TaxID=171585 RepID=UPI002167AA9B|nr:maternal protein tudor [Nymphalis io]